MGAGGSLAYRRSTPAASGAASQSALRNTDHLIGGVGIDGGTGDGSDEPALGYWLGQAYWGHGYAREAAAAVIDYGFRTLGLTMIRAYIPHLPNGVSSSDIWSRRTRPAPHGLETFAAVASDNEQFAGIVRVSTMLYRERGRLLQARAATQAIAALHPRVLHRSASSPVFWTRCAISVAYEAQSRDHWPDNLPNLRISVNGVFS